MSLNPAIVQVRMSFNSAQHTRIFHLCVVTFNVAHPVFMDAHHAPARRGATAAAVGPGAGGGRPGWGQIRILDKAPTHFTKVASIAC